jgi:hypothetical protein
LGGEKQLILKEDINGNCDEIQSLTLVRGDQNDVVYLGLSAEITPETLAKLR